MQTHNRYMNIIAIVITAACLWLAIACTKEYPIDYPHYGIRVISSELCEIDMPLVPSLEYVELWEASVQPQGTISYEVLKNLSGYSRAQQARGIRLNPEELRIARVLQVSEEQFKKHPFYLFAEVGEIDTLGDLLTNNSNGIPTDKLVAIIYLDHLVDLRTVPPEDRIPACIADVPVHIVVGRTFATLGS